MAQMNLYRVLEQQAGAGVTGQSLTGAELQQRYPWVDAVVVRYGTTVPPAHLIELSLATNWSYLLIRDAMMPPVVRVPELGALAPATGRRPYELVLRHADGA